MPLAVRSVISGAAVAAAWQRWDIATLQALLDSSAGVQTPDAAPWRTALQGLLAAMSEGQGALSYADLAYRDLRERGDAAGCALVARAALVLCVVDQAGMRHVQDWLQRTACAPALPLSLRTLDAWATLCAQVLGDADVDAAVEDTADPGRVKAALAGLRQSLEPLDPALSPDERLITAQILVTYSLQVGEAHQFDVLRESIEASPDYEAASPLTRARWCYTYGYACYHITRHDEARAAWDRGLVLAQAHGLAVTGAMLSLGHARLDVDLRLIDSARQRMASVPRGFGAGREAFRMYREQIDGRINLLDNMPATALSMLNKSLAAAHSARFSVAECGGCQSDRVQAMLAMEHYDDAIAELQRLVAAHRGRNQGVFHCYLHLIRAWHLRFDDPARGRVELAQGLRQVDTLDFRMFFRLLPAFAADLCALALSWGVERPLVLEILARRALTTSAPEHADEHWPWPVWLRLLGGDSVRVEGVEVIDGARKLPGKALQLLRYLGCQTTLSADLMEAAVAVWPELAEREGLAPDKREKLLRRNVEERIRDLRELLGQPAWVKVADSKIRLDASAINSDVCARRRLLHQLQQIADRARQPLARVDAGQLAQADRLASGIEQLSRGELLPTFDDYEWVDEQRSACDDDLRALKSAIATIRTSTLQRAA